MSRQSVFIVAILASLALATPAAGQVAEPETRNGVGPSGSPQSSDAAESTSEPFFITFDTGTSPCIFDEATPLRGRYAALGVRFRGPSAETGGAVLNQCGNFGVHAHSGEEFLAFNESTYAKTPEQVRFDALQRRVQMYVANGSASGESTFTLLGWREGAVVSRTSITTTVRGWTLIQVAHSRGIARVTLRASVPDVAFVVDDLQYTALS